MTLPRHCIDRFMIFFDTVIASGWCEKGGPGETLIDVEHKGHRVMTFVEEMYRPDLEKIYGLGAGSWGFTARACLPSSDGHQNSEADLVMRIQAPGIDEVTISNPGTHFLPVVDREFHAIFGEFIGMVCARGGRVLEIGARARSGVARREHFPAPLAYVGLDVSPGPNVDVVGDAHHLSRFVTGKVDAVFSISTFEHLLMPWKVALEINKVLKSGGLVFTHSHQSWPLHDEPWDFWRFSQDSWHGLYNRHTGFEIVKTKHAQHAFLSSAFPLPGIDRGICCLGSCCIARKVSRPEVAWEAEMEGIYNLAYSHGPTA